MTQITKEESRAGAGHALGLRPTETQIDHTFKANDNLTNIGCFVYTIIPLLDTNAPPPNPPPFGGARESDIKDTTTGCGFDLTIHRAAVKNFQMSCTLLTL
jgi:hypothetical protein